MFFNWQVLIGISVVLFAFSTLLQRILLRENKSDPITYSIFFQFTVGVLIGLYGFMFADMSMPRLQPLIINLVLMVVLYILSNIFIFNALKKIEASEYTIIFATRTLFTILASSFFLSQTLSLKQIMGALLVLVAVAMAVYKKTKFRFNKGEIFALLGAMFFGFATTNDKVLLSSFQLYPYVSIAFILPAIVMLIIFPQSLPKLKVFLEKELLMKTLLFCFIYAVGALTFFSALQISNNSSQIAVVNQTSTILIVLLGVAILKERDFLFRKLIAAALSVLGILLVI